MGQLVIEHGSVNLSLNRKHEAPLSYGEPLCEVIDDTFFRQRGEMLRIDLDLFHYRGWAKWLAGLICGVTDPRHPSCDENEPYALGVISRLGDDRTTPRVSHENDRTLLHGDDPTRRIRIVNQRRERILDSDHVKSTFF